MKVLIIPIALLMLAACGCAPDPKSGRGFSLPEGDPVRGQQLFSELQCAACHTVDGVEFDQPQNPDQTIVALGGKKFVVVTYGELVTSIINPSHRFAVHYTDDEIKDGDKSKMRTYNDELTITQLSDLVTFLESHYKVTPYEPTQYYPYY
ncbi:hypothetical protein K227x_05230 [Rubripirellula lacrimiformis]|uniref:Cytochrome c domain-containing protein n=1 Tax=Rubripirellula lacrimiformis TaxID=1930273 RepID=A0A517N4U9_9BACT|nr:c-type cytochrome [Rubripirellula lacrimiformis]QDT02152.1 hypothetical protein K227x_05230 [Rubripirellula lacrimiformis]